MGLIQIDWNPNEAKLRQFALIWLSGFGFIGLLLAWRLGCFSGLQSWTIPSLTWLVAVFVGVLGLLLPRAVKPVYRFWMGVTFPLGWTLSHLVLALMYYGVFSLVGLIFRIGGRDALRRRGKPGTDSFWINHSPKASIKRYFQQF